MAMQKRGFTNTRTRFQRLSDAKLFSGWVRSFNRSGLVVSIAKEAVVGVGEVFMFQVFGHESLAMFKATLALTMDEELTFAVMGPMQLLKSSEEMRILVEGLTGSISFEGSETDVLFVDVSSNGAGLVSPEPLPKDAVVEVRIDSPQGTVVFEGRVRYCKALENTREQFRIGLQIQPQTRIDSARWAKVIGEAA